MALVNSHIDHIETLMSWFPDKESSYLWCGPGLRYPFTKDTFLEDAQWGKMPTYSLLGEDNALIAFGQYYEKAGRCHLARLAVSPQVRGKGVGSKFIAELMGIGMRDLGVDECSLFVVKHNAAAIKCYSALQFTVTDYPAGHEYFADIQFMVAKNT